VLGSTVIYRWTERLLGSAQQRVAVTGLGLCGGFIVLSALPIGAAAQWALAFLSCVSNLLAFISLLALISSAATEDQQGWALGIVAAMTAASFFLSSLFASALGVIPVPLLLAAGGLIVAAGVLHLS
jgi:hypothetical protein